MSPAARGVAATFELREGTLFVYAAVAELKQSVAFDLADWSARSEPDGPLTAEKVISAFAPGLQDVVKAGIRELHRIRWAPNKRGGKRR